MLIKYIKLKNFLPFFGEQEIKFNVNAEKSENDSISVVIAANNSGKTSIIRALRYLFYGAGNEDSVKKFVNLEAIRTAPKGSEVECYIEAKILGSTDFTLRRTIRINKKGISLDNIKVDRLEIKRTVHESLGDREQGNDAKEQIQRLITDLLPERIFDFFFFKGEELADQILNKENASIKQSLTELLYQDKWKLAQESLVEVKTDFQKKLKKLRRDNDEFEKAFNEHKELKKFLDIADGIINEQEAELYSLNSEHSDLSRQIENLDTTSSRKLGEDIRTNDRMLGDLDRQFSQLDKQSRSDVGDQGSYIFLRKVYPEVLLLLESVKREKGLPKNITNSLINDLLRNGKCICGSGLDEGSCARELVEALKSNSYDDKNMEVLFNLKNRLEIAYNEDGYPAKAIQVARRINNANRNLDELKRRIESTKKKLSKLRKQFTEADEDNVNRLRNQRRTIKQKIDELKSNNQTLSQRILQSKSSVEVLKKTLSKLGRNPEEAKALQLIQVTDELDTMINSCVNNMQKNYHKTLHDSVSEIYNDIATDNSTAHIDEVSLLPEIEKDGVRGLMPGGGQQQTLVLSYIIALSRLRKQVNSLLKEEFGLGVRALGEQCFFMDSVFAPMQDEYREAVAKVLPGKMPQLVLLLSQNQWDKNIQQGLLKENIDSVYQMVQRTPKDIDEDSYSADFYGTRVNLVEKIADTDVQAHTIIKPMEV